MTQWRFHGRRNVYSDALAQFKNVKTEIATIADFIINFGTQLKNQAGSVSLSGKTIAGKHSTVEEANKWPTAEQLTAVVDRYHAAYSAMMFAYNSIPADRREVVTQPPPL
jgi:hypothetical protein